MNAFSSPCSALVLALALSVGAITLGACGSQGPRTFELTRSPSMPSADGYVKADVGANGNTNLTVIVANLAPPERVVSGATLYVVWVNLDPKNPAPQNVGVLVLKDDRSGRLETLTPLRDFEVMITAEANRNAGIPTGAPVLRTRVSQKK